MPTHEQAVLAGPSRPLGAPEIPQFHLPGSSRGTYAPRLYGSAKVRFGDRRRKVEETRRVAFLVPLEPGAKTIDWEAARPTDVMPEQLLKDAAVAGKYLPLPSSAMTLKMFTRWAKAFDRWVARTQRIEVAPKADSPEATSIGPKRGGVSVELVAIVWEIA